MSKNDLKEINDFFSKLPEVEAEKDIVQNKHHEFDVFRHTQKFVEYVSGLTDDKDIIVAGWLHDIGKPVTATPELDKDGNPVKDAGGRTYHDFHDHENVGAKMVDRIDINIFKKFNLNKDRVSRLVACHYIPMKGIKQMRKTKSFGEFTLSFNELDEQLSNLQVTKEEVLIMFLADKIAQGKFCTDKDELLLIRETLLKKDRKENDLKKIYEIQQKARK